MTIKDEYTAQNMIYRIAVIKQHECIIPNVFVYSWESDVISITKAGYVHEFEVKLTRADFKKDSEKKNKHEVLRRGYRNHKSSYDTYKIRQGIFKGDGMSVYEPRPNYFWYVCPDGLIAPADVPAYAGLIYLNGSYYNCFEKKAPLLHKDKVSEKIKDHIINAYRYKYWTERLRGKDE